MKKLNIGVCNMNEVRLENQFKKDYKNLLESFKENASEAMSYEERKEAAFEYLKSLFGLYNEYGSTIKSLDLLCEAVKSEISIGVGLNEEMVKENMSNIMSLIGNAALIYTV
jgi:hypothetical protein